MKPELALSVTEVAELVAERDRLRNELIATTIWLESLGSMLPAMKQPATRQIWSVKVLGRARLLRIVAGPAGMTTTQAETIEVRS